MDQINGIITKAVSSTGRTDRPVRTSQQLMHVRLEKIIIALWARMTQLYQHKWASTNGESPKEKNDKGQIVYTDSFLFWAKELQHLTNAQFSTAFKNLYAEIETNKRKGEESWPPNYIEFKVLATPMFASDVAAHKLFIPEALLTDEKQISKNKKSGRKNLDVMKRLFT